MFRRLVLRSSWPRPALSGRALPLPSCRHLHVDKNHSDVTAIRHFASKVHGRFADFSVIQADPEARASSVTFAIKTASIDTNNADRDNHLRAPTSSTRRRTPRSPSRAPR